MFDVHCRCTFAVLYQAYLHDAVITSYKIFLDGTTYGGGGGGGGGVGG